jgi:signal transduction histidine kinase
MTMFGSIRWRLVASYVLMTLLTVGVMGGLALSLVRHHVDQREVEYLTANAEAVARHALPLVGPAAQPEALRELAHTSAFLINARVRMLDSAHQVLADSGPVTTTDQMIWIAAPGMALPAVLGEPITSPAVPAEPFPLPAPPGLLSTPALRGQAASQTGPVIVTVLEHDVRPDEVDAVHRLDAVNAIAVVSSTRALAAGSPGEPNPLADGRITVVRRQIGPWGDRLAFETTHDGLIVGARSAATETRHLRFKAEFSAGGPLATWSAGPLASTGPTGRSARDVVVPVGGPAAAVGYVEISQGPDFATAAIQTTARAFGLAALGAAFLAGLVGLVVSRGMTAPVQSLAAAARQMSDGDLSSRAPVKGRDELADLARQFNAMAERLQASFAELGAERDALRRFIADASHELRTPITALRNFNELLQTTAATDRAVRDEFLIESQTQIRRLAWITANLLDLSRLDAGLITPDLDAHHPLDLIEAAVAPFRLAAAERGIVLGIQAILDDPASPTLVCDAARIELALSNLLDNALKFTPPGGNVEIGVLRRPARSTAIDPAQAAESFAGAVDARTVGAAAHPMEAAAGIAFWVRDDGPGIAPGDLPRVFDRFYRGESAGEPAAAPGSGLGLAIVQGVAQVHGGEAWAESGPGGGTCVWLWLPVPGE